MKTAVDPTAPPPLPPQPPRSSFSCDRHPDEQFSGFCPSCLCERLITLDKSSSNTPSRRPSSASATSAAIKSLFSSTSSKPNINNNSVLPPAPPKPVKSSFFPELRRTKSFSASKNEALGHFFEPQRKSCDVRLRNSNTLWSLFALDDENKIKTTDRKKPSASSSQNHVQYSQNIKLNDNSITNYKPLFQETENDDDFKDPENANAPDAEDEITVVLDSDLENLRDEAEIIQGEVKMKLMKDHIDLHTGEKKSYGGGFWAAASMFRKKWLNWKRVHKIKKRNNSENYSTTLPVDKPISRQYRETQSEVADYGFGRRSCDTDPRFSLDVGRISFDDPRYSFDEPRASWDGHFLGRSFPKMTAPMVSVMEDSAAVYISRSDMLIPVEETASIMTRNSCNEAEVVPGGSAQTRDYYSDSFSRRRKSLDRSSTLRNAEAAVAFEIDHSKVLPATADYDFHGTEVVLEGEKDLIELDSRTLRDDCSETFELSSGIKDCNSTIRNEERKDSKKSRSWSWRIWDLIHWFGNGTKEDDYDGIRGVDRSFSESWQGLDREENLNRKVFRSNSSVSWRNFNHFGGSFGSLRKSNVKINGNGNKGRSDEFVFEKNRSARYSSPNHIGNGPIRFYLTPMRSGRRGMIKPNNNSHSVARSVLRLY